MRHIPGQLGLYADDGPLVGRRLRFHAAAPCHDDIVMITAPIGPHASGLVCATCGKFRGWLSREAASFITATRDTFGDPDALPVIRSREARS